MLYLGIDPGGDGGLAIIDERKSIWGLSRYRDVEAPKFLSSFIGEGKIRTCIEDVHAVQGSGAKSTFNFGYNTGKVTGMIIMFYVWNNLDLNDFTKVIPQTWKDDMGISLGIHASKEEKKEASIQLAKELFPCVDLRPNKLCKNDHDGIAEALLIAEWNRRRYEK